jgi:RNA exonuclease 1
MYASRVPPLIDRYSLLMSYFQAVIQCVAALKRRPVPTDINHPSVGTEADIVERAETQKSLNSLRLSADTLKPLIHSVSDLEKWGYIIDIPPGVGGELPSMEGRIVKCDRCIQYYMAKPLEETETCIYHWGKPYTTKSGGASFSHLVSS